MIKQSAVEGRHTAIHTFSSNKISKHAISCSSLSLKLWPHEGRFNEDPVMKCKPEMFGLEIDNSYLETIGVLHCHVACELSKSN